MINASLMGWHCKHTSLQGASILTARIVSMLNMQTEYDLDSLGGRVGYALEKSGHTPSSAAVKINCKPQAIYQWIHGPTKNIKNDLIFKLSDITGFEARWITTGKGDPSITNVREPDATYEVPITPEEQAMLDTYRRLTKDQRNELLRGAEETKQRNIRILNELAGREINGK